MKDWFDWQLVRTLVLVTVLVAAGGILLARSNVKVLADVGKAMK